MPRNGLSALAWASGKGLTDIVVQLLKVGKVNLNIQANSGDTALSLASIHKHIEIVWLLLKRNPCEALTWAAGRGRREIVKSPNEHGPNGTRHEVKHKRLYDSNDQLTSKQPKTEVGQVAIDM